MDTDIGGTTILLSDTETVTVEQEDATGESLHIVWVDAVLQTLCKVPRWISGVYAKNTRTLCIIVILLLMSTSFVTENTGIYYTYLYWTCLWMACSELTGSNSAFNRKILIVKDNS